MSKTNLQKIDKPEEATHPIRLSDLKIFYETACHEVHGKGATRTVTYRLGYATPIGNVERSCWEQLAARAVKRELGEAKINEMHAFLISQGEDKRIPETSLNAEVLKILVGNLYTSEQWRLYSAYRAYCQQDGKR